jgi:hypothetical protein
MERPGPLALAKISSNYSHGSIPRYIEWEDYTSEEEELRADRLGIKPKDQGFRMIASEGHFKAMVTGADFVRRKITEPLDMQEVLRVREHAHGLLELVEPALYGELHVIYYDVLRGRVPLRMRRASMGEVRQFDRELHLDILETIQKREDSTMQEGIRWFLDHKEHSLWRLLDPQIEAMPDQSLERPWDGGGAVSRKRRLDVETGAIVPSVASQPADNGGCSTCGKRRSEHPNWRFCNEVHVPRWAQQRALAPPKAKPAGPGKGGKGKDKGKGKGKTPAWMVGRARGPHLRPRRQTGFSFAGEFTTQRGRLATTTLSAGKRTFAHHT